MHVTDALVSPSVAIAAGAVAIALIVVASKNIRNNTRQGLMPLMGIMAAFVFAAQMITFTIPGTGMSGHIVGGVLLAALLGPWCGFLCLCAVLIVQCVVFADGGLMALGCNIVNMGAMSCLVAYPLFFRPLMRRRTSQARLMAISVLASTIALELGALGVCVETWLSGSSPMPFVDSLIYIMPIYLAIGICEGVATGLVLIFVQKTSPELLCPEPSPWGVSNTAVERVQVHNRRLTLTILAILAVGMGVIFSCIASVEPVGFEWSVANMGQLLDLAPATRTFTVVIPDYSSRLSGIIGIGIVLVTIWVIATLTLRSKHKKSAPEHIHRWY